MSRKVPMLRELAIKPVSTFKQDSKLTAAIDKLYISKNCIFNINNNCGLSLPARKLNFIEVQQILCGTAKNTGPDKSQDTFLRQESDTRKELIKKIEDILNGINQRAEKGDTPNLIIRNQRLWSNCIYDLDRVTLKPFRDAKKTVVSYNSNSEEKTRFNTIVFVLTKVHELLTKNLTVTRREMFYQNVIRLCNQANLDVAVRDVCCLLETPPWSIGIVATAKGLIAGPLTMLYKDGTVIDCMTSGGVLIPQDINGIREFNSTAKYIIVVEKDAIFQKLLDEGALLRLGPVIILTGKGYPDVCTRQLLCRLCSEVRLPAVALVDADPHGYEIYLTYKYGSLAQSHLSSTLACGTLMLLGARHHDVMTLSSNQVRLPLTALDKRKLASLIKRPYLNNALGSQIKEELTAMLLSGVKAEIEALIPNMAALCDAYLPAKIIFADYLVESVMENDGNLVKNKKCANKAKSQCSGPPKIKNEHMKRKSFNVNDTVQSLDLAFGRLKKSKLVNGEHCISTPVSPTRAWGTDTFPGYSSSQFPQGPDSNSLMSMNFSHYELIRNLSRSNCNSECAFSGSTCNAKLNTSDPTVKSEHLERYFRSAEIWTRNLKRAGPSAVRFGIPDK